ncbi:T9SS sorting signal type C domain-containing protein [Flavobacterium procerum]|uniref:T9SS sorting signal type C domain-containing protein n=1 Tax=Flavobacterium procerum TaxID=1455569 RepID=A0ABV6BXW8_9FLAO
MKKKYSSNFILLISFVLSCSLNAYPVFGKPVFQNNNYPISHCNCIPVAERHRVWLNLTNNQGLFKQLLIGYMRGATNGYDHNYDAVTMDANKYADFYSINEGKKLVIQGRGLPFLLSDTVPLGYRSEIVGDLSISIDHADGDLADLDIYLEDKKTGIMHNLKESNYTFSTEKGAFLDRFVIRYAAQVNLENAQFDNNPENLVVVSKNKVITLKSYGNAVEQVSIYDAAGRLIYNISEIKTFDLEIDDIQSGSQVLLIRIFFEDGRKASKKIIF